MLTALTCSVPSPTTPPLAADLAMAGFEPLGPVARSDLVRQSVASAPDFIICYDPSPGPELFDAFTMIRETASCPLVLFTVDPDAQKMSMAVEAGVSAYVVNGYAANRLRAVVQVALARHRHDRALRDELAGLGQRFEERKIVDRAKGILMGTRQLREDEAYRALRAAAMDSKQRIGQVSQRLVDSARFAEAINRAGSLRMLSQRVVQLWALDRAGVHQPSDALPATVAQVDARLAMLDRLLSRATYGDLLDAVALPWRPLKQALAARPALARLGDLDRLAGELLTRAEQLTNSLEMAEPATALHVVNLAGRQRMLSQKIGKEAVLGVLLDGDDRAAVVASIVETSREFALGLAHLKTLPLTNPTIEADIGLATGAWDDLEPLLARSGARDDLQRIAALCDTLLEVAERLTDQYEVGIQALLHGRPASDARPKRSRRQRPEHAGA